MTTGRLIAIAPALVRALALVTLAALLALLLAAPTRAGEVFAKPPSPGGGLNTASWVSPDGSDSDTYAWDDFTLAATQTISEVRWRGGYAAGAPGGHVIDFRISFFDSIAGGSQPLIVALPEHESQEVVIATFHTNDDAGETLVDTVGGIAIYEYRFVLPQPVTLQGGVKYWFRALGAQPSLYPDWGMQTATGGDGSHFRYITGLHMFQSVPNDLTFSLHAKWADLGAGLVGTAGVPKLAGSGTLAAGSSCALALSGARPSSAVTLVFGVTQLDAPFKGGTLVPEPLGFVGLASDAAGKVSLPFVMPAGLPSGTDLVFQAWTKDPLAVHGLSASNGLSGTAP